MVPVVNGQNLVLLLLNVRVDKILNLRIFFLSAQIQFQAEVISPDSTFTLNELVDQLVKNILVRGRISLRFVAFDGSIQLLLALRKLHDHSQADQSTAAEEANLSSKFFLKLLLEIRIGSEIQELGYLVALQL